MAHFENEQHEEYVAQSPAGKQEDNDHDGKNLWWLAAILICVGLAIAVITVLI